MRDLRFRHYDALAADTIRSTVAFIHRDAYADAIGSGDPFESHESFMQRFDRHITHPLLDLVIAYIGDEPVGQIWGWPRQSPPTWAHGDTAGSGVGRADAEDKDTFALAEIMVRKAWTGQGIAHALHDELLSARTEQQAELYVRPENTRAYRAYLKWGWRRVGETRPDLPDAPIFDVLVLDLPIGA